LFFIEERKVGGKNGTKIEGKNGKRTNGSRRGRGHHKENVR